MLCQTIRIRNPKRGKESRTGRAGWYEYYAGYSTAFVEDAIEYTEPKPTGRILDPWNGGGTTTEVAASLGYEAIGFDLNPAMVIVAKARLLDPAVRGSLGSILDDLLLKTTKTGITNTDEPLATWFAPPGAVAVRQFERAIQTLLINAHEYRPLSELDTMKHVSSLAAFFYVATFRVLRLALRSFRSSNPTWLKQPQTPAQRITLGESRLHEMLREQVDKMAADLALPATNATTARAATIDRAASACLPIEDNSIDTVISSPPYCTRIDYVKKTGPELALLGARPFSIKKLRDQMIGTPTIHKATPTPDPSWGKTCLAAVGAISCHGSYASRSYYLKTYIQYFHGLYQSLNEIHRTLKRNGTCVLVVQDSYYKDLHIDLARIVGEMTQTFDWASVASVEFSTAKSIVGLNTRAIENGNPQRVTETVLGFRKEHRSRRNQI